MRNLYYDLQNGYLVCSPQNPRPLVPLSGLEAGTNNNFVLWGLMPSGNPASPYNIVPLMGALMTLSATGSSGATALASTGAWAISGSQLTGTLTIPGNVVFPVGQDYLACALAVDLTTATDVPHIETKCSLFDPSAPPAQPPLGSAFEPALGNPASDGSILSSLANGVRSWLATTTLGRSLLAVADAPSLRDLAGLGSAALATIGTAAGNVLALGSDGKLPAVDGSNLTNLPSASGGLPSTLTGLVYSTAGAPSAASGAQVSALVTGNINPGVVNAQGQVSAAYSPGGSSLRCLNASQSVNRVFLNLLDQGGLLTGAGSAVRWTGANNDAGGPVDSGLSRLAGGILAVGNGTPGDTSGSLVLAKMPAMKVYNVDLPPYNAQGGSADDTAAVAAAVADIIASPNSAGTLYFPGPAYTVSGITLGTANGVSRIGIRGGGKNGTQITVTGGGVGINLVNNPFGYFADFRLAKSGGRGTSVGIQIGGTSGGNASQGNVFERLEIDSFSTLIHTSSNTGGSVSGSCGSELVFREITGGNADSAVINDDFNALNNSFYGCDFQGCTYGWNIVVGSCRVYSCSTEACGVSYYLINPTNGVLPNLVSGFHAEACGCPFFICGSVILDNVEVTTLNTAIRPAANFTDFGTYGSSDPAIFIYGKGGSVSPNQTKVSIQNCVLAGGIAQLYTADVSIRECIVQATDVLTFSDQTPNDGQGSRYMIENCSTSAGPLTTSAPYRDRIGVFTASAMQDNITILPNGTMTLKGTISS